MSQPMNQDYLDVMMSRPCKRRSSIIQQAKKDGIISSEGDILRGLSDTLSSLRLSGSGHPNRGSTGILGGGAGAGGGKSYLGTIAQTPTSAASSVVRRGGPHPSGSKPSGSKNGAKPVPSGSKGSGTKLPIYNKSTKPPAPGGGGPGGLRSWGSQGTLNFRDNVGLGGGVGRGLRLQGNKESKSSFGMMMQTPTSAASSVVRRGGYQQSGSKLPIYSTASKPTPSGSLRSWGSQNSLNFRDNGGKGLTVPSNKDTKILAGMMHYVHGFLESRGFNNLPPNHLDLRNVSTNTYLNMVTAVGALFVGPKFFVVSKKEDPISKILELSYLLKYPSSMSKSHLKSANAPNSWPCCLTFLAWLCARAEEAYAPEPERPMNDLLNDGFPQIALDNYLKIYEAERAGINFQQVADDELNKFRNTVSEQLMGELSASIVDLTAMKQEKLKELEEITSTPDPSREVLETLEQTRKLCAETESKIRATEDKITTYKNIHTLQSQGQSLKIQIQNLKASIATLQSQIEAQPIDRKKADQLLAEVDEMRKQRGCLAKMHETLQTQIESQKEKNMELDAKFRDTVAKFTVVEAYNSNLSNLGITGLTVDVNPMTPEKLDPWLTAVAKIQEKSERASHNWLEAVIRDQTSVREKFRRAEEELATVRRQLETTKAATNAGSKLSREEERRKDAEVKKLEMELNRANEIVAAKEAELEAVSTTLSSKEEELREATEYLQKTIEGKKAWEDEREEAHSGYLMAEAEVTQRCWGTVKQVKEKMDQHVDRQQELLQRLRELRPDLFNNKGELMFPFNNPTLPPP